MASEKIAKRSLAVVRPGGKLVTIAGPVQEKAEGVQVIDFVVEANRTQLSEVARMFQKGSLKTNIGKTATLDQAVATYNAADRIPGKTVIRVC